jgi:anti-anti-sigma regulatory factor
MSQNADATINISLEGDWSVAGIAGQHQQLMQQLALLTAACEQTQLMDNRQPEIQLSGIDPLDACGSQLLALFLAKVKQIGLIPVLHGVSAPVRAKLQRLGFDHEVTTPAAVAKEQA